MATKTPSTSKSRATKPPRKSPATSKAKPAEAAPKSPDAVPQKPLVRRKELVARIVASTGMKPNQVKSVLDGVLDELGRALAAGEGLNVPPLGKLVVKRAKTVGDHDIMVCKLRRKTAQATQDTPLEPAE